MRAGRLPDRSVQHQGLDFCRRTAWEGHTGPGMDDEPGWPLSQAGWVVNIGLAGPPHEAEYAAQALLHGRNALCDRWPDIAPRLERLLQTGAK